MIVIPEEIDWTELTVSVIIGYAISWAYFFLTLPLMIKLIGKITGSIVNYGISWIVWIAVTIIIKKYNNDDE
jgi:hypothetical protein